jgi:hypothetical protein
MPFHVVFNREGGTQSCDCAGIFITQ